MTDLPAHWWPITDARAELGGEAGDLVQNWLTETVAAPDPRLRRGGPLCPFVPLTLRLGLLYATSYARRDLTEAALWAEAQRFLEVLPLPPDPKAMNKSLLIVCADGVGAELAEVVGATKADLIRRGMTCGEFYPDSDDRSARSQDVAVARSPVPLIALRYLSPHDELFLESHEVYGPLFDGWRAQHA